MPVEAVVAGGGGGINNNDNNSSQRYVFTYSDIYMYILNICFDLSSHEATHRVPQGWRLLGGGRHPVWQRRPKMYMYVYVSVQRLVSRFMYLSVYVYTFLLLLSKHPNMESNSNCTTS